MIELSPVSMLFMLEASIALLLVMLVLFLISKNNSKGDEVVSNKIIDKLQDTEKLKAKKLAELFSEHCELEPEDLNNLLAEIKENERNLYQQIIRIFLKRDVALLGKIDKHIDKFSEPYCKILSHASGGGGGGEKEKELEDKLNILTENNNRLAEQLTIAMSTMDEISDEYTRVFSGTQTELELENSSKKMFSIFQKAGQKISKTIVQES